MQQQLFKFLEIRLSQNRGENYLLLSINSYEIKFVREKRKKA